MADEDEIDVCLSLCPQCLNLILIACEMFFVSFSDLHFAMLNVTSSGLVEFSQSYARIHGRIVYPLTIFGILSSVVTIIVLHRKNFRTPTNLILQHIALFDTIVLMSFNIHSLYFYILHDPNPFVGQSRFWPHFAIFHSNVGLTAHSIALWLTCLLAIIRYSLICQSHQVLISSRTVLIWIWLLVLVSCLLMIPNYLSWRVVRHSAHDFYPDRYALNSSETVYWVSSARGDRLEKVSFALLAICFKLLPVTILLLFSVLLIIEIRRARRFRERLRCRSSSSLSYSSVHLKREVRTTTMLVFITLFTILVELPQGLLFIASGIDKNFFHFYSHLGDLCDIFSIGSSFITFIMYCSMSQQFRQEMVELLFPKCFFSSSSSSPTAKIDSQRRQRPAESTGRGAIN